MIKKLLLFSILLMLFGCKKIDKLTQFDVEYNDTVIIESSSSVNLPFNILTPDVETNSESTFAVNDTRKDLIEEILLKKFELTLTSPSGSNFNFLKSIHVYISAEGLDEVKIAWEATVPNDVSELKLNVTTADLKEYIKKDKFTLRLNTTTDEILTSDHHIDVHSLFWVDAKILGQ